jgi:hypothetical protein
MLFAHINTISPDELDYAPNSDTLNMMAMAMMGRGPTSSFSGFVFVTASILESIDSGDVQRYAGRRTEVENESKPAEEDKLVCTLPVAVGSPMT